MAWFLGRKGVQSASGTFVSVLDVGSLVCTGRIAYWAIRLPGVSCIQVIRRNRERSGHGLAVRLRTFSDPRFSILVRTRGVQTKIHGDTLAKHDSPRAWVAHRCCLLATGAGPARQGRVGGVCDEVRAGGLKPVDVFLVPDGAHSSIFGIFVPQVRFFGSGQASCTVSRTTSSAVVRPSKTNFLP